jgi:hypothetical protein
MTSAAEAFDHSWIFVAALEESALEPQSSLRDWSLFPLFPALKRWAISGRPSGADWVTSGDKALHMLGHLRGPGRPTLPRLYEHVPWPGWEGGGTGAFGAFLGLGAKSCQGGRRVEN